jgi:tetratricopeptide (TPR) repeat protein
MVSIEIKAKQKTKVRILLTGVILAAVIFAFFGVRWQIGNMLASLTQPSTPGSEDAARLAAGFSPRDPMAAWLLATKQKEKFGEDQSRLAVRMFEDVVRLSPYDFRMWIELARAYEQAEELERAEAAFRRAVDLAPEYTFPHWQLGNFYLRRNRAEEAFAELRKTTEKSVAYREQVFSLAWDYFDKDTNRIEGLAADTPDVRATLASFYSARGKSEDAVRLWNTLTDNEKQRHDAVAREMAQNLHDRKFYRASVEFARQTAIDAEAAAGSITNGSFEKFIGPPDETLFGWRLLRNDGRVDLALDPAVRSEGQRSLRVNFKAYSKPELYNVVQHVALEPGGKYRLTFMLRTENLRTAGSPQIAITAGAENALVGISPPFPTGTNDWQKVIVDFAVPPTADGVIVFTSRVNCGEGCPIAGTIWYDDFQITRL